MATGGLGHRTVKVIFGFLEQRGYGPEKLLCFRCGINGRRVVARNTASLQFPDPVTTRNGRQAVAVRQIEFDATLIELRVVEAPEFRSDAAERPNKRKLRCDDVNHQAEPHFLGKREAMVGFSLHLRKRFAREEEVRVEIVAHVGSIGEVSYSVGQFESAAQQINASPHMFRPAYDENREAMMGARLIAF